MNDVFELNTMNQKVNLQFDDGIQVSIKREDLIHPFVSGNKYRKLKYNIIEAKNQKLDTLLTFGGAYSNHIAAVAATGKLENFKTIGIIRGDELANQIDLNPTLQFAAKSGMVFQFVSRTDYRKKEDFDFLENLKSAFGSFYLIPEGGTNALAVQGCKEIITQTDTDFEYICTSVGTGGTIAGLCNGSLSHQKIIGFPALKCDFLDKEISKFATHNNYELMTNYHFGGYGKTTPELIRFINNFYTKTQIPLDPIYTGKMVFGVFDLLKNNYFKPNSKILIIHTGGLQGVIGMNAKLKNKGLETLNLYE
jgi:1-aminocyclopropane-1-carboxylate deaminase